MISALGTITRPCEVGPVGRRYCLTYSGPREDDCVGVARAQPVHYTTGVPVEVVVVEVVAIGLRLGAAVPRLKIEGSILRRRKRFSWGWEQKGYSSLVV